MSRKYIWWTVAAIVFIAVAYFLHYVLPDSKELDFFLSLIGTSFTILGIAVTFDQIQQTRRKADETSRAVEETKSRIQAMTRAFSVVDATRLADEIESYLRNQLLVESRMKLKEFTQILSAIIGDEAGDNDETTINNLSRLRQQIQRDVNNVNRPDSDCRDIDWSNIIQHVEETKNILIEHSNKINKAV